MYLVLEIDTKTVIALLVIQLSALVKKYVKF